MLQNVCIYIYICLFLFIHSFVTFSFMYLFIFTYITDNMSVCICEKNDDSGCREGIAKVDPVQAGAPAFISSSG